MVVEVEGSTVAHRFLATVRSCPDRTALRWRADDGSFSSITYGEYADSVARVTAGLRARGLGPGTRMVMMMRNIPQFHILDIAATFCGATPVSIYNSSSADQIRYLVAHSEARIAVVQNSDFLDRFLAVRSQLPHLEHILVIDDNAVSRDAVGRYADLFEHGSVDLDVEVGSCRPEQLATLIYTSGTTGSPKAVMLDHTNIVWTAAATRQAIGWDSYQGRRLVSYLPMAHIAERIVSHYLAMFEGMEVTTCPDPRTIGDYLKEVRPEVVFGVPRVWEKIYGAVNVAVAGDPEKKKHFDEAIEAAIPITEKMAWGRASDEELETWKFLDEVAFASVRELIGLDNCELAVSSAAPLSADVLRWFRAIGVPMSEVYGLSETTGPMTWEPYRIKPGSSGIALPGTEVTLADDGEVLCHGANIFRGYFKDEDKTAEVLDADGWLHTGDIGQLDEAGNLRITDRLKDMYICGGFNVYPAEIEQVLARLDGVADVAVIGVPDGRLGEVGKAFVVRRPGSQLDEEQVIAYARKYLANFKAPRSVVFVDVLPRNPGGKVVKSQLREWA